MKFIYLFIFVFFILSVNVFSLDMNDMEWNDYKIKYKKYFEDKPDESRSYKNFLETRALIENHNKKYYSGEVTYKLSLNRMAHYDQVDRLELFYGFNMTKNIEFQNKNHPPTFISPENVVIPKSVNWLEQGAVTEVKDQDFCGSCWAFASTGSLEGQHYRLTQKLVSLSEQNLIDCTWDYGNNGCFGGIMTSSYQYVRDNKGIDKKDTYPYDGEDWYCRFQATGVGATDNGYVEIPAGDEDKLMEAVATIGPISVAINADDEFQFYKEGIYVGKPCEDYEYVNHAVLVVGYDTDEKNGLDYWLVKNSWSTEWGEKGYIRITRNVKNTNCIAKMASYPLM